MLIISLNDIDLKAVLEEALNLIKKKGCNDLNDSSIDEKDKIIPGDDDFSAVEIMNSILKLIKYSEINKKKIAQKSIKK